MAMFVLVVDTSLMNVSISSVIKDLHTTASSVQSAIALEALVSAAFILIGSKIGDLIGRKRAYVLGLLGYAIGALSMVARAEPDRDHHLLGDHRRTRRVAAAARDAVADPRQLRGRRSEEGIRAGRRGGRDRRGGRTAARGLSHDVPVVAGRLCARGRGDRDRAVGHQARPRRALHGPASGRFGRRRAVRGGDGRDRARDPRMAGGRRIGRGADRDRGALARGAGVVARAAQARGQADAGRSGPVQVKALPVRDHRPDAPADRARRDDDRAADLPAAGARVQRAAGGPVAGAAVADDVRGGAGRRQAGRQAPSEQSDPARDSHC